MKPSLIPLPPPAPALPIKSSPALSTSYDPTAKSLWGPQSLCLADFIPARLTLLRPQGQASLLFLQPGKQVPPQGLCMCKSFRQKCSSPWGPLSLPTQSPSLTMLSKSLSADTTHPSLAHSFFPALITKWVTPSRLAHQAQQTPCSGTTVLLGAHKNILISFEMRR